MRDYRRITENDLITLVSKGDNKAIKELRKRVSQLQINSQLISIGTLDMYVEDIKESAYQDNGVDIYDDSLLYELFDEVEMIVNNNKNK